MFCSHCGHELKEDYHFCPMCGTKVEPAQPKDPFPHSYLYQDTGGEDLFPMKVPCTTGQHEFVVHLTHKIACTGTPVNVEFSVCQKCGKMYFGSFPSRYGVVVAEKYTEIDTLPEDYFS